MSMPNRTARKAAAITDTTSKSRTSANKAVTGSDKPAAGAGSNRVAKPTLGRNIGNKDRGPVYEVPKPIRPKPVKK